MKALDADITAKRETREREVAAFTEVKERVNHAKRLEVAYSTIFFFFHLYSPRLSVRKCEKF
jgi:hypothetical protein